MLDRITKYINAQKMALITQSFKEIFCEHRWIKYGHGYKCKHCGYYTEMDDKLNKQIKKIKDK